MSNIIEIRNLSFEYEKDIKVLNGLDLSIEANTINAILGANGSGKSTLLDCLIGINKPLEGEIKIESKRVDDYTNREFAKKLAYISQSVSINIDYSVREFILFGRSPYLPIGKGPEEADYIKCNEYAEKLGITHLLGKSITKISGGERQLCFICRALVQESDVMVFDEPMSALDFGNQSKLLKIFSDLQTEGKTIVFTTHNPNQVLDLNCNVIVLDEGKVACFGKAESVITKELLEKIYKRPFGEAKKHYTFES